MHAFQVTRTPRGELQAQTCIPLGTDRRELRITTDKAYRGGIECEASVVQMSEDGRSYTHAFAMSSHGKGDFRKTLATDRTKRATEKALATMHAAALAGADAVLQEARDFYALQAASAAA